MKIKYHIILILLTALLIISCEKKDSTSEGGEMEETQQKEDQHEEAPAIIAALSEDQIKTVGISLGTIEMKELTSTIKANGVLRVPNNNKAAITSMYGGIIKTLHVQIGDFVKKGQVIASISNPEYIQLQEQYLTVKSRLAFAEQEYSRQKELFDNDAGAKKNLQSSDAELRTLRTQRSSLQRQLQIMGISPAQVNNGNLKSGLVIKSPISGTISAISAQIGSYVDISSPVAEIIDNGSLHLDLQIFEKDLPKMKVGQAVHFNLTNNPETEYDAKVYSIGSSFENDSKTISVHCTVTGNKAGLIDGMNITGIVSLNNVTTPAVPNDAIVNADGKYYVFFQTDRKADHHQKEAETENTQKETEHKEEKTNMNFEKTEVLKGVSDMGYTAVTFVKQIPADTKIVIKGAYFVNAKLNNTGGHEH